MKHCATFSLIVSVVALPSFAQRAEDVAMQLIRPEAIAAHMRFLADDLLEGRGTGTRGYEIAAKYVAAQFEAIGLEPAGSGGAYFQSVPLRRLHLIPEQSSVAIIHNGREEPLVFERDFLMGSPRALTETSVRAPLVFVGFGVEAPELGYDDYAGLDARGKIVAMFPGAPSRFPAAERAHFSASFVKERQAAAHGAVGIVILWAGETEKHFSFERMTGFFHEPEFCWLNPDGVPNDYVPELRGIAVFSKEVSPKLFQNCPKTFEQALAESEAGKPRSFPLAPSLMIRGSAHHTPTQSPNIAGVLRGSDPELRNEYVVYSAHVDHLGIGPAVDGDSIYNGAQDNASGIAALLEVARSFTRLAQHPRRSILFLAVTGEEAGLLGSDYFAHHPTVPRTAMVANVNIDGITLSYDFRDIVAFGEEHSTLGKLVRQAAQHMDLEVSPDPMPEEVFFIRGDQYSFVRQGVPAVSLSEGFKTVDPKIDGKKITLEWEAKIYHTPKDDMNQPLNFVAGARCTRLNFLVGYLAAQTEERPRWTPGDFFGKTFAGLK
jgi:Zn-dependent M28 family amino/carboxypeptidase